MKISGIDIYQLGEQSAGGATWAGNSIILKLTTSDGEVGFGEAVPTLRVEPVIGSLREVARVYQGKNPLDVEANLHEWHKHDFYMPMSFESTTAASAFDIACWDIIGKHYGAPIRDLMGGSFRDRVRLYANGWYDNCVTPEEFGERAAKWAKMGYTGLKFDVFGAYYDYIDEAGLDSAYDRVKAVRDATDGKVSMMIEHHGRFNPTSAIMIAKKLSDLDPLFMEEPIHPDNLEGLEKYRKSTDVRVALGERLLTKEQVVYVLKNNLTDFLQADITNIGGVTVAKKIVQLLRRLASRWRSTMLSARSKMPLLYSLTPRFQTFLSRNLSGTPSLPGRRELVRNQTPVERGHSTVSTRPGIGVEVDEKIIEKYIASGQEYFNPDEPVWVVKNTWKNEGV